MIREIVTWGVIAIDLKAVGYKVLVSIATKKIKLIQ
jgi:hypothetical protein